MTDNRTTELRKALDFMRIWISDDAHLGESEFSYELEKAEGLRKLEAIEQAIAATLGSERDEIYNAGFDNGIKATLHQLDGLLVKTDSAVEIQAFVDEQWKEYES